jgi:DNA-binding FadR family transcriptional regulator
MSPDDVERLEASLETQRMASEDPVRFMICDREFHLAIYYASANKLLADFVVDLYTYMLDHRRIAMAQLGAIEKSLEDHRSIVRALKTRDPDAVSAAFSNHILRIRDTSLAIDEEGRAAAHPRTARAI